MASITVPVEETGPTTPPEERAEQTQGGKPDPFAAFTSREEAEAALKARFGEPEAQSEEPPAAADDAQDQSPKEGTEEESAPYFGEKTDAERQQEVADYGEFVAGAIDKAGINAAKLAEVYASEGDLLPNAYEALAKQGFSKEMVQQYLAGGGDQAASIQDQVFTDVGGESAYQEMMTWAVDNVPQDELTRYDRVVESGNAEAIRYAAQSLKAKYDAANGTEGRMLAGKRAPAPQGFRSVAEIVAAKRDPRYAADSAYREDVQRKLASSANLFKSR